MTEVEQIVARARRARVLFRFAIGLVCLAAFGFGVFAVVVNVQQDTRITKVESACASDPDSAECQRIKRETDQQRSIADTCIAFWKVGYPCPKPGTDRTIAAPRSTRGGDALQPTSGGQEPASGSPEASDPPAKHKPPEKRDPDDVDEGNEQVAPPAAQTDPPAAIDTDTPGKGNGPPADTPAAQAPGLVGDVTGPLGGAIDDVGKGVDKALCPVADRLAGLCD